VEPATIRVFSTAAFLTGLGIGFAVLAVGVTWSLAKHRRELPVAGLLIAAGFLAALDVTYGVDPKVWIGAVLLGAAGAIGSLGGWRRLPAMIASFGGAGFLAVSVRDALPTGHIRVGDLVPWFPWFLLFVIPLVGILVSDFDRRNRTVSVPLLSITAVGLFFLVPDTELARVLLGVALPVALLGWPLPTARLGTAGAYAATGVLFWAAAIDGRGRPATLIVTVACFGLLVAEPLSRLAARARVPHQWQPILWVAAGVLQLATAAASSRLLPSKISLVGAVVFTLGLLLAAGGLFALVRERIMPRGAS